MILGLLVNGTTGIEMDLDPHSLAVPIVDMIDEGFADPGSADCGGTDAANHSLEPVLAGNFKVHQ
jgi:hypothetical protein